MLPLIVSLLAVAAAAFFKLVITLLLLVVAPPVYAGIFISDPNEINRNIKEPLAISHKTVADYAS